MLGAEGMNYQEFRKLVREMMNAQKRYFKSRDNLDECKKLERQVREELQRGDEGQKELFP